MFSAAGPHWHELPPHPPAAVPHPPGAVLHPPLGVPQAHPPGVAPQAHESTACGRPRPVTRYSLPIRSNKKTAVPSAPAGALIRMYRLKLASS